MASHLAKFRTVGMWGDMLCHDVKTSKDQVMYFCTVFDLAGSVKTAIQHAFV